MKGRRSEARLWVALAASAALLYTLYYAILRDARLVVVSIVGNIAFIPIQIGLVTLTIQRLLETRERRARLEKLNMVIGAFFSEVGVDLLKVIASLDPAMDETGKDLQVSGEWTEHSFSEAGRRIACRTHSLRIGVEGWMRLRDLLGDKVGFMLHQLENPNLLEHESFTELLRAVLHLAEEFSYRDGVRGLPETDYDHLRGEVDRIYCQLAVYWLDYMKYLKNRYPYLFSLAVRTNSFNPDASAIVR
ncbi:MAG: hypothetical protein ACM3X4_08210 [Ignavibacteriales bacterium]